MNITPLAIIILAAGKGTRMKSSLPKVMHPVAGRPMLGHVIAAVEALGPQRIVVVVAPGMEDVAAYVAPHETVVQAEALGTAHAVAAAAPLLRDFAGDIIIIYGDHPLSQTASLSRLLEARRSGERPAIVMMGMHPKNPAKFGRLIVGPNGLEKIVEAADCSPAEAAIDLVWAGQLVADGKTLFRLLDQIDNKNAKNEYYLSAIIEKARAIDISCAVVEAGEEESLGIDTRAYLAIAEKTMQHRYRTAAMENGATLIDPETVYFSYDTKIGRDVIIEPNVFFAPGVTVEDGAHIRAFCHIEQSQIGPGATIGPFARLRPGTKVGEDGVIGNFVEIKNTTVGRHSKAKHLSYLGDTDIGENTNVGAGTITCNWDGYLKYRTTLGDSVFVGANSVFVSPITVGNGANVAAGSIITQDVPAEALAIGRARQVNKEGRATLFRALKKAQKDARNKP